MGNIKYKRKVKKTIKNFYISPKQTFRNNDVRIFELANTIQLIFKSISWFYMTWVFTERYYRIEFNTLAAENENFLPYNGFLLFSLQLIISQKRQQQQYITNATFNQFLSILQVTFFARNVNKIAHFQGEFFSGLFFHCNRNSIEKAFFYATTAKLNSKNNCIKSFLFADTTRSKSRCQLLRGKIPFLVLRKILLNVKHFSPVESENMQILWCFKH